MEEQIKTLDVREDINAGRHPLARILGTVESLKPGEALRLIAPFEPKPLMAMLETRGFTWQRKDLPSGDYEILFRQPPEKQTPQPRATAVTETKTLDLRGLMPPEPMVRALEAAESLAPGAELLVITDRNPLHLLNELQRRGFESKTEALCHEHSCTRIRRN